MTFRDFAQGAFRMRGIGKGQTIVLMIIPEVQSLIKKVADTSNILVDVAAWLVVNACKSQKVQFNLLCEQSVSNVWRKTAFRVLETHHREVGVSEKSNALNTLIKTFGFGSSEDEDSKSGNEVDLLDTCVDTFRVRQYNPFDSSQERNIHYPNITQNTGSCQLLRGQRRSQTQTVFR
jgi:hypothetical protein